VSETPRAIVAMGMAAELGRERAAKSADAFRTISEVAEQLDIPQHVLRFWETRFSQVRPLKRAGGRRYYRPEDVDLLRRIRSLLYQQGYTIKGVQKLLRETSRPPEIDRLVEPAGLAEAAPARMQADVAEARGEHGAMEAIASVIAELEAIRAELLLLKLDSTKR
jgi:DNA-binding transcriptional MerR regulator